MPVPRLVRLRAARKRAKIPPRAVRWTRSPQTPRGVELSYVLALKRIAARWGAKAQELLLPIAKRVIKPAPDTHAARTDEEDDSPYAKALNSLGSYGGAYADGTEFASAQIATAKKTIAHSKSEFQRIGVKLREAEPLLDKGIREWRSTNVDLVKSMLDGQRDILSDILTGYEGHSYDTIAKQIAERCGVASSRAEFIARDQVLKLNSNITTARMAAAGVAEFIWTTTGDERVRPMHEELDGQQFSFDDPPVTNEDGDENLPGEDYQCRCVPTPVIPDFDEEPQNDTTEEDAPAPADWTPESESKGLLGDAIAAMDDTARPQLQRAIMTVLPDAVSKDTALQFVVDEPYLKSIGAGAVHQWDGTIRISENDRLNAIDFFRSRSTAPPYYEAGSARTLIHEELHGFSRVSANAYSHISVQQLEEIGTELNARHIIRELSGLPLEDMTISYRAYIADISKIVQVEAGVSKDRSLEMLREAHAKSMLIAGEKFQTAKDYVDAWVGAIDATPSQRQAIRKYFSA